MVVRDQHLVRAASFAELKKTNCLAVNLEGHSLVLFAYGDTAYAVDNRCPHMGFPLHKGTVRDGILTCHWHHARFDLATGGTFDQWADDVRAFPVEVRDGEVWVDLTPRTDMKVYRRQRLRDGLERTISLVIAKSVIGLLNDGEEPAEPFRIGLEFGTRYRADGWGQGLTILACMANLIAYLDVEDRPRALYHGLSAVANNSSGMAPRFLIAPLPGDMTDIATLKRWFRQFVEVRDSEAAERCIISAIRAGATSEELADMLFAAATDHRYIDIGHPLDFTNKALEALDIAGWEHAEAALTSLVPNYTGAQRMEEANEWRYPIDLVAILEAAFEVLPDAVATGRSRRSSRPEYDVIVPVLLGEDPTAIVDVLLDALRSGTTAVDLAGVVAYAAALRIAHFHTSNEFGDWDTALHTFTFANAVHQGLRRVNSADLLRGVFDAAMSVYLDRFLNVPPVRLPSANGAATPEALLDDYSALLNRQQQVNEAGALVMNFLGRGGDPKRLLAQMGRLLLREDRDFHTIQCIEAAFRQYTLLADTPYAPHVLVAAARYLAAHAPTMRSQGQTFQIANRLARGENLFEEGISG